MSPRAEPGPEVIEQATKLDDALRAAARLGISRRSVAEAAAGPTATKKRVENLMRQITKWRNAHNGPNDESARALGRAFVELGLTQYGGDYFVKRRPAPTWADRIRETAQETYAEEFQRLRDELENERRENERRHEQLLAELRELKEAL